MWRRKKKKKRFTNFKNRTGHHHIPGKVTSPEKSAGSVQGWKSTCLYPEWSACATLKKHVLISGRKCVFSPDQRHSWCTLGTEQHNAVVSSIKQSQKVKRFPDAFHKLPWIFIYASLKLSQLTVGFDDDLSKYCFLFWKNLFKSLPVSVCLSLSLSLCLCLSLSRILSASSSSLCLSLTLSLSDPISPSRSLSLSLFHSVAKIADWKRADTYMNFKSVTEDDVCLISYIHSTRDFAQELCHTLSRIKTADKETWKFTSSSH